MQIYADVTRRPLAWSAPSRHRRWARPSTRRSPRAATRRARGRGAMGRRRKARYLPDPASADVYDELYAEYLRCTTTSAAGAERGHAPAPRAARPGPAAPPGRRGDSGHERGPARRWTRGPADRVRTCTRNWSRHGLVAWTSGNISARVPGHGPDGDQAQRRGLRGTDPRGDGRLRPDGRRVDGVNAATARPATRPRTPTSTGTCRGWAASCTPTRGTRRRGRRAASRSRASSRRWPTSSAARSRSGRSR